MVGVEDCHSWLHCPMEDFNSGVGVVWHILPLCHTIPTVVLFVTDFCFINYNIQSLMTVNNLLFVVDVDNSGHWLVSGLLFVDVDVLDCTCTEPYFCLQSVIAC